MPIPRSRLLPSTPLGACLLMMLLAAPSVSSSQIVADTVARRTTVIALGGSMAAGLIGVEGLWSPQGQPLAVGAGVGIAGIGARAIVPFYQSKKSSRSVQRWYVDGGYLATPWHIWDIEGSGAVFGEVGYQVWPVRRGGLFGDFGLGMLRVVNGTWDDGTVGFVARLQFGWGL